MTTRPSWSARQDFPVLKQRLKKKKNRGCPRKTGGSVTLEGANNDCTRVLVEGEAYHRTTAMVLGSHRCKNAVEQPRGLWLAGSLLRAGLGRTLVGELNASLLLGFVMILEPVVSRAICFLVDTVSTRGAGGLWKCT